MMFGRGRRLGRLERAVYTKVDAELNMMLDRLEAGLDRETFLRVLKILAPRRAAKTQEKEAAPCTES